MITEKFPKAPITEALFDIQIEPILGLSAKDIEVVHPELASAYPIKKPRRLWETKLEIKEGNPVQTVSEDKGIQGYQFWTTDEKQVAQFRLDGYSFSRLKPYGSWEECFPEAIKVWKIYLNNFRPTNIKRLALRYINLIEIPSTKVELNDYFTQPPQPPAELPQDLEEFLSRIVIRFDKTTHAITTLMTQPQAKHDVLRIAFDIDVFSIVNLPATYDKLEIEFGKLHSIAWNIFKKSIKSKTEDLFK